MEIVTLSPSPVELHVEGFEVETRSTAIRIVTKRAVGRCPACGELSDRVHSRYTRVLSDLPWLGIPVRLLRRTPAPSVSPHHPHQP